MRRLFARYRSQLNDYRSLLPYSLLGVLGGLVSGAIVIGFEASIALLASLWGVGDDGEAFERLPAMLLFALPAGGALILGGAFTLLRPEDRETGILHVIRRMHSHYSILPLRNALVQFIAGAFALATGQSGGREGPGVHLGGAANSLLGNRLGLPNNSLRVLIACGTAGGISAAFNTPLAGVIFAMEVIVVEYTVVGFIPVILAAVSASAFSRALSPDGPLVSLPALQLNSLQELPLIVVLGFCCGLAVAAYIKLSALTAKLTQWPVVLRFTFAGCFTGLLALWVPQVLGAGYDTLALTLHGEIALGLLLTIALAKLLATAVSCGVGMPIGLIGPNMLIGACIGGVLGIAGGHLLPGTASDPSLYVILGMGAAMGAVLNAPLAAILAVIELTQTIGISMAAMLAIVAATLTNGGLFRQPSAHLGVLRQLKQAVPDDPLTQMLHRTNINSTMDSRVVRVPEVLSEDDLTTLRGANANWCLVGRNDTDLYLVDGTALLEWLAQCATDNGDIDITEAGIRRWAVSPVPIQATLRQAMDSMREHTTEAVCVYERSRGSGRQILHGIATRDSIEAFSLASLSPAPYQS